MKPKQTLERQRKLQEKRITRRARVEQSRRAELDKRRNEAVASRTLVKQLEDAVAAAVERITRRDFLRHTAGAGLALEFSPLMATCGGENPDAATPPPGKETRSSIGSTSITLRKAPRCRSRRPPKSTRPSSRSISGATCTRSTTRCCSCPGRESPSPPSACGCRRNRAPARDACRHERAGRKERAWMKTAARLRTLLTSTSCRSDSA